MSSSNVLLILLSVFILAFSLSAIAAEDVSVAGHSFDIPDGYSVNDTLDTSVKLVNGNNSNYTIFIAQVDESDSNLTIASREVSGFKFLAEENYTSQSDVEINQQNYVKNDTYFSYYSFDSNNESFVVIYSFPADGDFLEGQDNPVNTIIETFQ